MFLLDIKLNHKLFISFAPKNLIFAPKNMIFDANDANIKKINFFASKIVGASITVHQLGFFGCKKNLEISGFLEKAVSCSWLLSLFYNRRHKLKLFISFAPHKKF